MRYVKRPAGATQQTIEELESKFCVILPADLREFFLQSDGPILWFGHKELQLMSVAEILGDDIYDLKQYMPGALPLSMDGNGNLCVARIEDRAVTGYFVVACGDLGWSEAVEIGTSFWHVLRDSVSPEKKLDK